MAKVTIYTTPTCAYCRAAKEYFKTHNIAYVEKDVTQDLAAQQEMIQKSGQLGVPVIDVELKNSMRYYYTPRHYCFCALTPRHFGHRAY